MGRLVVMVDEFNCLARGRVGGGPTYLIMSASSQIWKQRDFGSRVSVHILPVRAL